jgi:pyrimidine operon attenuation protein/uracil phosphoribosyltransferase
MEYWLDLQRVRRLFEAVMI